MKPSTMSFIAFLLFCLISTIFATGGEERFGLSEKEISHFTEQHITYRTNATPSASNMQYVEWDDKIAQLAYDYARTCPKQHGMQQSPDGPLGQNIFWAAASIFQSAVAAWYSERNYYNNTIGECEKGFLCGHYTTLVWASVKKFGCASSHCENNRILICNYFPVTNIANQAPYRMGRPCTECNHEVGNMCHRNLCISKEICDKRRFICGCKQYCLNCANFDQVSCSCNCKNGWDGMDCSLPCKNEHEACGKSQGWADKSYCKSDDNIKNFLCREMCEECKPIDQGNTDGSCCSGKTCKADEALNKQCKCISKKEAIKEAFMAFPEKYPAGEEPKRDGSDASESCYACPRLLVAIVFNVLLLRVLKYN